MAKTIVLNTAQLFEVRIAQSAPGQFVVYTAFGLLAGTQLVSMGNSVPSTLSSADMATIGAAFAAVQAAVTREQIG